MRLSADIRAIAGEFRELGVRQVGATHCTGPASIALLQESFGEDFVGLGVGRVLGYPI